MHEKQLTSQTWRSFFNDWRKQQPNVKRWKNCWIKILETNTNFEFATGVNHHLVDAAEQTAFKYKYQ